jgi:hypothetical protein
MGDASTQSQGARDTLHVQSVQHRENEGGGNLIRESPFARSCTREGVRVQHSTLVQLGAPEDSKEAPASRTESVSDTCMVTGAQVQAWHADWKMSGAAVGGKRLSRAIHSGTTGRAGLFVCSQVEVE